MYLDVVILCDGIWDSYLVLGYGIGLLNFMGCEVGVFHFLELRTGFTCAIQGWNILLHMPNIRI